MDAPIKYPIWESPPPALVEYSPKGQILLIEIGQMSEVGEEIAQDVIVHYDKDDDNAPSAAVAIRIDRAEYVLKPFVDAIMAKHGLKRGETKKAQGETVYEPLKYPIWESPPPAIVEYSPEGKILVIETGQMSAAAQEMAEDVIVHYDKDEPDAPSSAVAIRIDRAEYVLKPFVDAILAKYGSKREPEEEPAASQAQD